MRPEIIAVMSHLNLATVLGMAEDPSHIRIPRVPVDKYMEMVPYRKCLSVDQMYLFVDYKREVRYNKVKRGFLGSPNLNPNPNPFLTLSMHYYCCVSMLPLLLLLLLLLLFLLGLKANVQQRGLIRDCFLGLFQYFHELSVILGSFLQEIPKLRGNNTE